MTARLTRARPSHLAALVVSLALAALFVVGVLTQPHAEPSRRIEGLVLDGESTTTAPISSAGRPVEPIPHRTIEEDDDG